YIRTAIRNGPECLLLRCPDALCDAAVGRDMVHLLVSDEEKEMYSRYIIRSQVEANSKVQPAFCFVTLSAMSISDVFDAWFDDEVGVRKTVGLMEKPTVQYPNGHALTCRKCFEIYPRSTMFCASCGHLFCTVCWLGYIHKSIHGGPNCLMLRCPEATCNAAVDQDMVDFIVSDEEKAMYNDYVLRSYIEDNRKGLAQMFMEHTLERYGNCVINYNDDILNLIAQALSDTPEGSIISGIDAAHEVIEPNDRGDQQKVYRRRLGGPIMWRMTFATPKYYLFFLSEHTLYDDKKIKTLPSKPQDGNLYLLEINWVAPLKEYFIAGHLTEQLKDDYVWVRQQGCKNKARVQVLYFMVEGSTFQRRVYGHEDYQNVLLVQYAHTKKNILGPQCDEMIRTVSKPSEERDVENQAFGSASSTEKDAFDRKRKVDEGGLIDDRRPEKYLKYADFDEMIHTVSKLSNDKDVKNQTFGSASSMEKDVFDRKRIA
ncbi:hypothetical protein AQUCO_00300132v1, partial [Aquilegia coerulea]